MGSPAGIVSHQEAVKRAFSKQAPTYDALDRSNPILCAWRRQVYAHVDRFMQAHRAILELNAGTGIDAVRFASAGHRVHATDISPGMIRQIQRKTEEQTIKGFLTCQQCSFDRLNEIQSGGFDYVFSNFGGLNCSEDLAGVTRFLGPLLKPGAFITLVIMPPVCLWELKGIFQGHSKAAFRRLNSNGATAFVEGEQFKTYYYSLRQVREAFGNNFVLKQVEGLGALSPPPSSANFVRRHPRTYRLLTLLDNLVRHVFPMNRWADHLIITFQYDPK